MPSPDGRTPGIGVIAQVMGSNSWEILAKTPESSLPGTAPIVFLSSCGDTCGESEGAAVCTCATSNSNEEPEEDVFGFASMGLDAEEAQEKQEEKEDLLQKWLEEAMDLDAHSGGPISEPPKVYYRSSTPPRASRRWEKKEEEAKSRKLLKKSNPTGKR